ncbi:NAD(P)/FAD-dependent oxidoreductase [Azospirillum himalayense]|uniref:NAD(P)/FAD-dependent oxidoreductase n=1 Tax=Azospirillum himalayense TaxID=654847 RepID=A0ABW0GDI2_9PROT
MTTNKAVLVVGAGQAGAEACWALRQGGFAGDITLVGAEATPPYERPPLSKKFLNGTLDAERLFLRGPAAYADAGVSLKLGRRVVGLDPAASVAMLDDGERLSFDWAILATGSGARALSIPGIGLAGVHALRTMEDADRLRAGLLKGGRLVVIGGGYLGLEAAATGRKLGCDVTVLESAAGLLQRSVSRQTGAYFEAKHRAEGVDLRLGAAVARIEGDGRAERVVTADDTALPADLVLVAVGGVPETGLAEIAGLECRNGILVDADCRSSVATIFAVGDCANHFDPALGRHVRLEAVQTAIAQARCAAAAILGAPRPAPKTPYFWSDQYGVKLQIAGLIDPSQPCEDILLGDAGTSFAIHRIQGGVLAAVETVNRPVDFVRAQKLLGKPVDIAAVA